MFMDTKQLDNWNKLTSFLYQHQYSRFKTPVETKTEVYNSLQHEILDIKNDYHKNYIEPFKKELLSNILLMESANGKRDIIKYYISAFITFNENFQSKQGERFLEIIQSGDRDYRVDSNIIIGEEEKGVELTTKEIYLLSLFNIMDEMFNVIQDFCFIFNINFFELCDELGFKCNAITCENAYYSQLLEPYKKWYSIIGTPWEPEVDELKGIDSKKLKDIKKAKGKLLTTEAETLQKPDKPFQKYFDYKYANELADKIKIEFHGVYGVDTALLVHLLRDKEEDLIINRREQSHFLRVMEHFMGHKIGSRSDIFYGKRDFNDTKLKDFESRITKIKKEIEPLKANTDN